MVYNVRPHTVVERGDDILHDRRAMHIVNCGYMRLTASNRLWCIDGNIGRVRCGGYSRERGGVRSVVPERLSNARERALALDEGY